MIRSSQKLICFDVGRVLVRICDGWKHACEVARVPLPAYDICDARRAEIMKLVVENELGRIDQAGFAKAAGPILGIDAEHVIALSNAYLLETYAGADLLIDEVRAAGHKTACLSNVNHAHWAFLTDPGNACSRAVMKLDWRFGSHLIAARKPDAGAYEAVERETGFGAGRIVFFDDLVENVEAAKARGWMGIHVPKCENPVLGMRRQLADMGLI